MPLIPNKYGYVRNSISVLSVLAFLTALFSFIAIEFLYSKPDSYSSNNLVRQRTAYIKELEAFPVEPGQGSAYFKLEGNNSFLGEELSVDLKIINDENKNINAFALALFIPDTLTFVTKPENSLIQNGVINFVEYQTVSNGTQVNIFGAAKNGTTLISNSSTLVISFKFLPKNSGSYSINFVKSVPQYPEIMDTLSQSLLDISVLKDLSLLVEKPTAEKPIIIPESGEFNNAVKVTVDTKSPNSSVKYTFDNSDPRTSTTAISINTFPQEITLSDNLLKVLKAYTYGNTYNPSDVVTKTYSYKVADITAGSTPNVVITTPIRETLNTTTSEAKIYYTLDGSDPSDISNAILYDGVGINLNHTVTLKAVGFKNGYTPSSVFTKQYIFSAPEVSYKGFGFCISENECEYGIDDINKTTLTLRYDASDPSNIPTKIGYYIYDEGGMLKKIIENITPIGEIFTVNVENYLNYFKYNEPNFIKLRSYSNNGVYSEKSFVPKLNMLPIIEDYSPLQLVTYNPKIIFKVTASDGNELNENSGFSFVELFKKELDGNFYSIKKTNVAQSGTRIVNFSLEDTLTQAGNYEYFIKVYDNSLLTRSTNNIKISYYEKGDVNKDFKLDIPNDLFAIIKAIFGSILPNIDSMDLTLDGKVDPLDIIKLLKKLFI